MRKACFFLLLAVSLTANLWAQNVPDDDYVRLLRINKIDFYHISAGLSSGINYNYAVGYRLSAGIGTFRNILNLDMGFRHLFLNSLPVDRKEWLSIQQIPIFFSVGLNFYRWKKNSLYVGAEVAYYLSTAPQHHLASATQRDAHIAHNHFATAVKTGFRHDNLDFSFSCQYRLAPAFDQKYIYESYQYDYDLLRKYIFERFFVGIEFTYHIAV